MKNTFRNSFKAALWSIALVFGMMACTQMEDLDPNNMDVELSAFMDSSNPFARMSGTPAVEPIFWNQGNGGNATCDDAASQFDGVDGFEQSSGRINYVDGVFEGTWPDGLEVQVIDGKVYWQYTAPEGFCLENMSVIVKGGPAANIYNYESGIYHDGGLVAPVNAGNGKGKKAAAPTPAGLSNLTFCFNLTDAPEAPVVEASEMTACFGDGENEVLSLTATATVQEGATLVWFDENGEVVTDEPTLSEIGTVTYYAEAQFFNGCVSVERTAVTLTLEDCDDTVIEEDDCYAEQTAYGGASPGTGSAWWYYFDTKGDSEQMIYAGQNPTDAKVIYDSENDIITIDLGSLKLQSDSEAVKVLGYDVVPSQRPASGGQSPRFYAGTGLEIEGNGSKFYVIHIDALVPIECPIEE